MPMISSLKPMKKMIRTLAMIYWYDGMAPSLTNIRKAMILPIKIAMPPSVGVVLRWEARLFGASTYDLARAMSMMDGIRTMLMKRAREKLKTILRSSVNMKYLMADMVFIIG